VSYSEVVGNLFDADVDALAHGVNCQGSMGGGIAAEFARRYPKMKDRYAELCEARLLNPGSYYLRRSDKPAIYNLATQQLPGPDAQLEWIEIAVKAMLKDAESVGMKSIAMPRIGCGIGGLQWSEVGPAIQKLATQSSIDLTVYVLQGEHSP
jgi:O-acetyl-ADP-ribose deacetylase (regulator of RNase III)